MYKIIAYEKKQDNSKGKKLAESKYPTEAAAKQAIETLRCLSYGWKKGLRDSAIVTKRPVPTYPTALRNATIFGNVMFVGPINTKA